MAPGEPLTRLERPPGEVAKTGEQSQKETAADSPGESATEPESALTKRNREQSPLLRLPGEIRNRIYEYAIGGYNVRVADAYVYPSKESLPYIENTDGNFIHLANLGRVCKQLRKETKLLPYALSNFYLHHPSELLRWSKKLSPEAKSEIRWIRNHSFERENDEFFHELSTFPNVEKISFCQYVAEVNQKEFEAEIAKYGGKWQVVRGGGWYWDKD